MTEEIEVRVPRKVEARVTDDIDAEVAADIEVQVADPGLTTTARIQHAVPLDGATFLVGHSPSRARREDAASDGVAVRTP